MNERIRALDARYGATDATCVLLCECELSGCTESVEVPVAVHAETCATPGRYIVIPGHEAEDSFVIAREDSHAVIAFEPAIPDGMSAGPPSQRPAVSLDPAATPGSA